MIVTIKGLLISIGPKQNYKRGPAAQVRISEDGTSNDIPIDFYGERCDVLSAVATGQKVAVKAEIIGRSYLGSEGATKYLAVLNGISISTETVGENNAIENTETAATL